MTSDVLFEVAQGLTIRRNVEGGDGMSDRLSSVELQEDRVQRLVASVEWAKMATQLRVIELDFELKKYGVEKELERMRLVAAASGGKGGSALN